MIIINTFVLILLFYLVFGGLCTNISPLLLFFLFLTNSSNAVDYVRAGDSKQEISFFLPRHFNSVYMRAAVRRSRYCRRRTTSAEATALVLVQLGRASSAPDDE